MANTRRPRPLRPLLFRFCRLRALLLAVGVSAGLGAACAHTGGVAQAPATARDTNYPGKLPEGATPRLYEVHLTLDPNAERFHGVLDVAVDLLEPDDRIVMHAENLAVHVAQVGAADGHVRHVRPVLHAEDGTLVLHFDRPLPAGVNTLHFEYDAPYGEGLTGIYRVQADGRSYLFSQFEPLAARRAFPCFDEPRFKAPWQLTLTVPQDVFAASTTQVAAEQTHTPGQKTLTFQPTPPLPSYLLSVAVGPFDVLEGELPVSPQRPYAVPLRGLAAAKSGPKLKYAVERTGAFVQALESYVDLPYPFAKLDVVAVPDFAWGAMENAGLITFRDWLLLLDGEAPPYSQKRAYTSVMAHELTHQWFGNWVTMPWWDDLWLNEAFASWRGQRIAQRIRPGMQFDVELVEAAGNAMAEDGLPSVRRVREPCRTRDDVHNAADTITYQKGAGILTMFEHFIGPERFMQGVRSYLKRFAFANADSATFLNTLGRAGGEPALVEAMQTFLDQPGVPEVSFSWRCDNGSAQLQLAQERWRPLGAELHDGLWKVPVCVRYGRGAQKGQRACFLLREGSETVPLHGGCPEWFVANADGAGYYRSRVDDDEAVQRAWTLRRLSAPEAFAVLDNAAAELTSGAAEARRTLGHIADALGHDNPRVVRRALGHLEALRRRHLPAATWAEANAKLGALLRPQAQRVGTEVQRLAAASAARPQHGAEAQAVRDALGEATLTFKELQRALALSAQDPEVRAKLAHQGTAWLDAFEHAEPANRDAALRVVQRQEGLDGDAIDLALTAAADNVGAPFVERLVAALGHAAGGEVRKRLVQALAQVQEPGGAQLVRELVLAPAVHRNEVLALLHPQLDAGPQQAEAWAWVGTHLDALLATLSEKDRGRLVTAGSGQCDQKAADALDAQFAPRIATLPGGARVLAQAKERIVQCAAERRVQGAGVQAYFVGR